jgi:ligand-binding SRPBCC domain-containing protein
MKKSFFLCEVLLPKAVSQIFPFFGNARNLQLITPPWLRFEILTPDPIVMQEGALIDYRISLRGVPLRWRTRIELWDPPRRFIDVQIKGPYRLWHHEHLFEPRGQNTLCVDRLEYAVPGGLIIDRLFVRRDIEQIFAFRHEKLLELIPISSTAEAGDQATPGINLQT